MVFEIPDYSKYCKPTIFSKKGRLGIYYAVYNEFAELIYWSYSIFECIVYCVKLERETYKRNAKIKR